MSFHQHGPRLYGGAYGMSLVMDYKLPSSGVNQDLIDKDRYYKNLDQNDVVKFVIGDERDYVEAVVMAQELANNGCTAMMAFSPTYGGVEPARLAEWLLLSPLRDVVLSIQLHKYFFKDNEKKLEEEPE